MLSNSQLYSKWRKRLAQLAPDECESRLKNMLYLAYTQALLSAVPSIEAGPSKTIKTLKGDVPSPFNPPPGCKFQGRCPLVEKNAGKGRSRHAPFPRPTWSAAGKLKSNRSTSHFKSFKQGQDQGGSRRTTTVIVNYFEDWPSRSNAEIEP